jgi:hypothetical protein
MCGHEGNTVSTVTSHGIPCDRYLGSPLARWLLPSNELQTFIVPLLACIVGCSLSRCMAMLMYCWHALKLEGVHRAVAQPCVDQIRHSIFNSDSSIILFFWVTFLNIGQIIPSDHSIGISSLFHILHIRLYNLVLTYNIHALKIPIYYLILQLYYFLIFG